MNDKQKGKISKFMSYALRHKPEEVGIILDDQGWVSIDSLNTAINKNGFSVDKNDIHEIVETNDKKRFTLSESNTHIRASQGHSFKGVSIQYSAVEPPDVLYHGTATRFKESILEKGLVAGERHHVHLSQNMQTATSVGSRHGKPLIFEVDAKRMYENGYTFYLSENDVYLVDNIPSSFLTIM